MLVIEGITEEASRYFCCQQT